MRISKMCQAAVLSAALMLGGTLGTAAAADQPAAEVHSQITAADIANPSLADPGTTVAQDDVEASRTAAAAIKWFKSRNGSTAYQGYCERAVRLAWDRKTHHASAIDHWNSSDGKKHKTGTPPKGAFVFWNISEYGHVGIADGNGGFWAASVNGAIGHAKSVHYFNDCLGWKPGNSN